MKILAEWVTHYRTYEMNQETRDLINMAKMDLWFGPYSQGDYEEEDPSRETKWPGFQTATDRIRDALASVPSTLYVSHDGNWTEEEPWLTDPETDEPVEPDLDFYQVDRKDLIRVLVGKDLAEYVQ